MNPDEPNRTDGDPLLDELGDLANLLNAEVKRTIPAPPRLDPPELQPLETPPPPAAGGMAKEATDHDADDSAIPILRTVVQPQLHLESATDPKTLESVVELMIDRELSTLREEMKTRIMAELKKLLGKPTT